jgi:hypothetical protein
MFGAGGFVGVLREVENCFPDGRACEPTIQLLAGRLTGPLRVIASDRGSENDLITRRSVSMSGGKLAYVWDPRPSDPAVHPRLVVVDLRRRGAREVITLVHALESVVFRGRFLAWSPWPQPERQDAPEKKILVYSLASHRVVSTVGAARFHARFISNWDMQPDGTLAVAYWQSRHRSLGWISAPYHRPHVIAGASPGSMYVADPAIYTMVPIRVASRRIAFLENQYHLDVVDFAGHRMEIRRFSTKHLLLDLFDFNGSQVLWSEQDPTGGKTTCTGDTCGFYPTGPELVLREALPRQLGHS